MNQFDHIFKTKLESWTPLGRGFHDFFPDEDIEKIRQADRTFDGASRTIIFVVFENKYASLGGLAAIADSMPQFIQQSGEPIAFFSPYHCNNKKIREAGAQGRFTTLFKEIDFSSGAYSGKVCCLQDSTAKIPSYYCAIDGHFLPPEDPYHYSDPSLLAIDALVFCAALPAVFKKLGLTKNLLIHAHDWETAALALTSKMALLDKQLSSAKTILTLHNSYDAHLPKSLAQRFFGHATAAETFLQMFIPLLSGPLTTVSTPFAHELLHDPLQRGVFTPHLQAVFSKNPPIGVENGAFTDHTAPFSEPALLKCEHGDFSMALAEKNITRRGLFDRLQSCRDPRALGEMKLNGGDAAAPVFFMSGRLDFMQKGFDAVIRAFQRLLRGKAKLLFCPNISGALPANVDDFISEALRNCKGDMVIWPFPISSREYFDLLGGASFMVMPSLYEPFGCATEAFAAGTPVVARATGGLWAQVRPCNNIRIPAFYRNILQYSGTPKEPTGILFREEFPDLSAEEAWKTFVTLPLCRRCESPLYESIVESAASALRTAIDVYANPTRYGALVYNAAASTAGFSWTDTIGNYRKVYDKTSLNSI
jgi:glycogen synthase